MACDPELSADARRVRDKEQERIAFLRAYAAARGPLMDADCPDSKLVVELRAFRAAGVVLDGQALFDAIEATRKP